MKENTNKIIYKITRLNDWKNYILPFLLGIIFMSVYIFEIQFGLALRITGLLMVSIIGTAAYGYLLNNIFDLEEDKRAGKSNYTENMPGLVKTAFVLIFLAVALVPWLFLPVAFLNSGLFILQLVQLAAYSIPPVRLKRFVHIGVIIDALYNSVIMVFVIIFTIKEYSEISPENGNLILIVLFAVLFLKGLRGILLHQLSDRKNDRKSGVNTFVLKYGALTTSNIINRLLIPIELLVLFLLIIMLSRYIPGLQWVYLAFLFYKALKLRFWNIRDILRWDYKFYRFIFQYSINDFYEEWFPLFLTVLLTAQDVNFAFILIPYMMLFPAFFIKLFKDVPEIIVNFRNDIKNFFNY